MELDPPPSQQTPPRYFPFPRLPRPKSSCLNQRWNGPQNLRLLHPRRQISSSRIRLFGNSVARWMCRYRCRALFVSFSVCQSPPSSPSKRSRNRTPSLPPRPHSPLKHRVPRRHLFRQPTLADRNRNDAILLEFQPPYLPRLPSGQRRGRAPFPTSALAALASHSPATSPLLHHKMPMSSSKLPWGYSNYTVRHRNDPSGSLSEHRSPISSSRSICPSEKRPPSWPHWSKLHRKRLCLSVLRSYLQQNRRSN